MSKKELIDLIWSTKAVIINNSKLCKIVKPRAKHGSVASFILCFTSVNNKSERYYILKQDKIEIEYGRIKISSQDNKISFHMDILVKHEFKGPDKIIS